MHHSRMYRRFKPRQEHTSPPLGAARSALPGCSPRRTSCPGNGARSSRGFSASYRRAACGRTCTVPPVCTAGTRRHTTIRLLRGHSIVAQIHSHREQLALRSDTEMETDTYRPSWLLQVTPNTPALFQSLIMPLAVCLSLSKCRKQSNIKHICWKHIKYCSN